MSITNTKRMFADYSNPSCHLYCEQATESDCQDEQHDVARNTVRRNRIWVTASSYGCTGSRLTVATRVEPILCVSVVTR